MRISQTGENVCFEEEDANSHLDLHPFATQSLLVLRGWYTLMHGAASVNGKAQEMKAIQWRARHYASRNAR